MKQKRSQIGCLFWVALVLLALVVVLFNRPGFEKTLKSIGVSNLISTHVPPSKPPTLTRVEQSPAISEPRAHENPVAQPKGSGGQSTPNSENSASTPPPVQLPPAPGTGPQVAIRSPAPHKRSQPFQIYFVQLGSGGNAHLVPISRDVTFIDEPLTKTIDLLLKGVTSSEKEHGIASLIPSGTTLINARVSNGTAYLNFSDRFRFNSLGKEGYDRAVKQVVYTATQFPTVQRVQILLDGQIREYLGPEGLAIGSPLDRKSLAE